MPEILFAGGRLENVFPSGTITQSTTGGRFDAAYADCALYFPITANSFSTKLYTASAGLLTETTIVTGQTFFTHFDFFGALFGGGSSSTGIANLVDSDGFTWFRIVGSNGPNHIIQYNSGTGASPVWTTIGGLEAALSTNTLMTFDIECTLGSPHDVKVYINGSLWKSATFTQALFTNIASVRYAGSGNDANYSQMMSTEGISTVGGKVRTARATGAGTTNEWTNTHTAVNEVVGTDATVQSSGTAGQKATHAMTDVTLPAGFEIRSVFNWMRAKNDGSAPQNIKSVLRQGGVDYATGNLNGMGLGYALVGARYDLAPDGTAWDATKWNAIEAGYESAT